MTHIWLEHPETGGKQQFPEVAAEWWRARGWVDTDPPPEPDLLHDPLPADESGGDVVEAEFEAAEAANSVAEPADESASEPVGEQGAGVSETTTSTRSRRGKRGEATAAEEE